MFVLNIDWNAVSAIGQCLGALLTAAAVYYAVKKDKPRIRVHLMSYDENADGRSFKVSVINTGFIPVKIIYAAIETPGLKESFLTWKRADIIVNPIESKEVATVTFKNGLRGYTLKKPHRIQYFVYVKDYLGNKYYEEFYKKTWLKRIWISLFEVKRDKSKFYRY